MGSSGNLSIVSLNDYPFEKIKEHMLNKILDRCSEWYEPHDPYDEMYFDANDFKSIDDLISYFECTVASYCPEENGININGTFYDNWARQKMPQVIDNHLVLYDTDQQSWHQNHPSELLWGLASDNVEIWT